MASLRLDAWLVEKGYFDSRERAKKAILAGHIYQGNVCLNKPSIKMDEDATIEIRGEQLRYVSRGGLKLEKALQIFPIDLNHKTIVDIGASTGGFTDCALQNGASYVYAIDVGSMQLHQKLRQDPRVNCIENYNFRYVKEDIFTNGLPSFACIDVSFISLKHILLPLHTVLSPQGEVVCLIKPQFEAGKENIGKKGIVKDPKIHLFVLRQVIQYIHEAHFSLKGLTISPIKGGDGNIEFLAYLTHEEGKDLLDIDLEAIVQQGH